MHDETNVVKAPEECEYWTLVLTEQIRPQHIVGEDSMDNEDEPHKGELNYFRHVKQQISSSKHSVELRVRLV